MPRQARVLSVVTVVIVLLLAAGCSRASGEPAEEIVIGASLPLGGERSQLGEATQQGYQVWEELVNEEGGILGRPVRLEVRDDASNLERTRANYQALIDQEGVDLLLGTFSSLQNEPASAVAEQRQMVFVCPSCGNEGLFERGFDYFFFAQPAPSRNQADLFAQWVASLPASERPKTAAYPKIDDPFAAPVADSIRTQLEAVGIETVYDAAAYAPKTAGGAMDAIANAIKASGAELVAHGADYEDGIEMVRSMQKVGYNPQILFQTAAPSAGAQYQDSVGGPRATEGVFYAVSWSPDLNYHQNQAFVARYQQKFGETPPEDAANGFGAAQVLHAAVEGVGSVQDQAKLADWLHENEVETVMGPLSWDPNGRPQQAYTLAQWQDGASKIVLPRDVANTDDIIVDKPAWQS